MFRGVRTRDRAWIGLGVLLGLIVGDVPAADGCSMRAVAASACHADSVLTPEPARQRCCSSGDAPAALPPGPTGADGACRTRTASCCCAVGGTQAVAERSTRAGASRSDARADAEARSAVIPPIPASDPLPTSTGPSRPAPSRIPLYLRTARLRN